MGLLTWLSNLVSTAAESGPVQVQESLPMGMADYADPDLSLPGDQNAQNWRRITQGTSDLSPLTQERMQQLAFYLSDKNPLAKGILDLIVSFIVGEGFTATAKDPNVQTILNRFWEDGQNDLDTRVEDMTRELSIFGEQVVLAFVHQTSGRVALVSVDPRQIKSVLPHPLATDRAHALALIDPAGSTTPRYIKIIAEDDDPGSATYGKLVGASDGETIKIGEKQEPFYQPPADQTEDGQTSLVGCFFWAINKPRSAMRGRSDLLSAADFVDLYDRLMFDESERMSFLRTFVWDVEIVGATESDLNQRAAREVAPKPGGVKFHNESETWTAVAPQLNTQDSQNVADLILSLVATAVALPKTWLNGIMDVNRASAQSMDAPNLKRLSRRQRYVRRLIERMVRFALDQAEIAGTLGPAGDERHAFAVSTPDMSSRDLEIAGRSLMMVVQAMGLAAAGGWLDDQTAQEAMALVLSQLGLDVDLAEIQARLKQAEADKAKAEADQTDGSGDFPSDLFKLGHLAGPAEIATSINGNGTAVHANGTGASPGAAGGATAVSPAAKDMASIIKTISDALVELGNSRVIDGEVAQQVVAKLFAGLGVPIDVEAMQQRLADELAAAQPAPAQQPPAAGGAGAPTLPDVSQLINLDVHALEAVRDVGWRVILGDTDAERPIALLDVAEAAGFDRLLEAFEASLHPRGPGGKFATKGDQPGGADQPDGDGGDAGDEQSAAIAAKVTELVKQLTQQAAAAETAKPKAQRKPPEHPPMNKEELGATIKDLQEGADVTLKLTNGLEVAGKVFAKAGGSAVIQTADGKYAILHSGLKGVASIASQDWENAAGPREPRKPRATAGASTATKAPVDRSAAAKKAAATRAANKAAAQSGGGA